MNVMKFFRRISVLIVIIISALPAHSATRQAYDIIIAGAGTGGISAAIQAARMGRSILVVEPSSWIGGQATAAGVSTMDDMSRQKSGIYLEFIDRIKKYYDYQGKSMGTCYWNSKISVAFEPHIGQEALTGMINEARRTGIIDFLMNSNIIEVKKTGKNITGITAQLPDRSKRSYQCKILIDATEYGDILPLSQTSYRVGNSKSNFVNRDSMIQDITWVAIMRKYPGGIPANLKPSTPLPGYEDARENYRSYVTSDGLNFRNTYPVALPVNFMTHNAYRGLPDSGNPWNYDADKDLRPYITKTSVNWGNDYPGTYGWEGKRGLPVSYLEDRNMRRQIEHDALIKTLHFIYYVQNELGEDWSVADDEYRSRTLPEAATGLPREWQEIARRLPVIPYVRESRRIIAKHTMTSHEILQNSLSYRDGQTSHEFQDAIAIGGYILDLHGAQTDADMEWDLDERANNAVINRPRGPFQVPMDILIPEDTEGLIAAEKNISASRLAAGALRLQPITMMTGQAAGALAAVCARDGRLPSRVHAVRVQWELLKSGVNLSLCAYSDVPPEHPHNKTVQISNLYGLAEAQEYPHAPSYNIRDFDDPVIAMAILRGADKGIFGADSMITRGEFDTIIRNAMKAVYIQNNQSITGDKAHNFISRGDMAKAVLDAFPALKDIETGAKLPFKLGKHRNAEYVNTLGLLGVLDTYGDGNTFSYGSPVTKSEAVDVIVRAMVIAAGA